MNSALSHNLTNITIFMNIHVVVEHSSPITFLYNHR